jgi:hypothetical protein
MGSNVADVLNVLSGSGIPQHLEDITFLAWKKYPDKFKWKLVQYDYPDKTLVRRALKSIVKKGLAYKNGDMYLLSPKGQELANIEKPTPSEFSKVRKAELFIKYQDNKIRWDEELLFRDILNVSPDSSQRVADSELRSLISKATRIGDIEVATFLRMCSNKFSKVVG